MNHQIRIVQLRYESKNLDSHWVWHIFLPSLLAFPCRVLWQIFPGTLWASIFWFVAFVDEPFRVQRRTWLGRLASVPLYCGALANGAVTLANGGKMPGDDVKERWSLWVPATESHHLLWLGDNYWGFSLGDFGIFIGFACFLLLSCATHIVERAGRKQEALL